MLDKETSIFLEKIAKDNATGMSQLKKRIVKRDQDYTGTGAGLGAILGAGAGALSPKYKPMTAGVGGLIGALAGREMGKRTVGKTRTETQEGVMKKQQKARTPKIPIMDDAKILKLLKH